MHITGVGHNPTEPIEPEFDITPTVKAFVDVVVGEYVEQEYVITNISGGKLIISDIDMEGDDAFERVYDEMEMQIPLGFEDENSFTVRFMPNVAGVFVGSIIITAIPLHINSTTIMFKPSNDIRYSERIYSSFDN